MTKPRWIDVHAPKVVLKALSWGPPDAPIALCLHGFPDTAYGWRKFAPRLVESGWRVVAPFMRGYAPSSIPSDGSYHVGALMDDALRVRDSGFASPDVWPGEPIFLTYADPFERFRIGTGDGSWNTDPGKQKLMPGVQFPVDAYANFMKQTVPRWLSTDDAIIAGYVALVDKVCPCVLLTHSQGGSFGFKVAELRPEKFKAIVAVESASAGDPAKAAALKNVPVLMMFGDNVDLHSRWVAYRKLDLEYAAAVRAGGGKVDVINLPDLGITGNSHMVMMDKNNGAVAEVIAKWLTDLGLATAQESHDQQSR
jgi:pimeloyl-ACP methyl ester carboxylesterase